MLWCDWRNLVCELRPACARIRTFLWMALCLAGLTTRKDLPGVSNIVRALGLAPACYDRLLDFFHSPALDLDKLTRAWCALVFRIHPGILRVNGRPVLVGDGIKVAKPGRIHEGAVFSNRDHRTLLDKMILLLDSLGLQLPFYFVADAYSRRRPAPSMASRG